MRYTLESLKDLIGDFLKAYPDATIDQSFLSWMNGFENEIKDFMLEQEMCNFSGYYGKPVYDKLKEILGQV